MDSVKNRIDEQPADELPVQPTVDATKVEFDSKSDAYAEAELLSRHRRIELMIEKATSLGDANAPKRAPVA